MSFSDVMGRYLTETDVNDLDEITSMKNKPATVEDGWDSEVALTEAFAMLKVAP